MSRQSEAAAEAAAEAGDLEVVPVTQGNLLDVLAGKAPLEVVGPSKKEITARIVKDMLMAETEEDLWREVPTWSSKSNVGFIFRVTDVRGVYESRFEDADTGEKGWFVCFDAVRLETGEIGVLTSSAARICGRVGWYYDHGMLPQDFEIVTRGQTAGGYDILDVDKAA